MSNVTVLRSMIKIQALLIIPECPVALETLSRERFHHSLTRKSQKTQQFQIFRTCAYPIRIDIRSASILRFKGTYLASLPAWLMGGLTPALSLKAI